MITGNDGYQNIFLARELFTVLFDNTANSILTICPASVILLGDHTHYNEGVLISVCIDKYWISLMRKRKDKEITIASTETNNISRFNLNELEEKSDDQFKLLKGLLKILKDEGKLQHGFDCVVSSSVPECIGLGSLAAQQVGFLNCIKKLFSLDLNDEKLLSIVRRNELNHIGKISNIAHHYTVQHGKEKKIFVMDLRTKEHKTISFGNDEYSLVICDSGERIIDPQKICNERIEECEIGVKGLRLYIWGIKNLRDIKMEFLHQHIHMLPKRIFDRVLYNVKERIRAEEAIKYMRKKSLLEFGRTILDSHNDLSEDYDLSNEHCDYLVKESTKIGGVLCSKMISCSPIRSTFNIVADGKVDQYINEIKNSYNQKFQKQLKTHVVKLSSGAKKIIFKDFELSLQ